MSFFNSFWGSSEVKLSEFWHKIESENDLAEAIESSTENTVVIFKHSTRCIISKTVLRNFEKQIIDLKNINKLQFYYLDLISYRDISNKIAEDFGVTHQSPQMIVIKDKKAIKNASHENINLNLVID